ncbi:hypothetical protein H7347_08645 [Corynebacterium sp. zg-331]|uniref:hypothetical protein n=1 Tax=unclassified Corynebacterium TaxID=2624378 RepID=UPI00128E59F0|nr:MULTISPECIES: hypothetical protein [unclassified Corynebacterium]MBC3186631.1 hypothetical protein [Corynebacterium sp. zg-331]MPV53115.1 hypothetical protein [Corynebacterium sp. zg331]
MTQTDYYSLDDTRAGRLAQAAFVGGWEALPDYVSSRAARAAIKIVLAVGGAGLVGALNMIDEDPRNDPAALLDEVDLSPAQTWAGLACGAAALICLPALSSRLRARAVDRLRRRGIRRPHTALGAVAAALVFLVSEVRA